MTELICDFWGQNIYENITDFAKNYKFTEFLWMSVSADIFNTRKSR